MREKSLEQVKSEIKNLVESTDEVERKIENYGSDLKKETEMKYLARIIYAGKIIEKAGLLYSFNEQSLYEFLAANKNKLQNPPD